MIRSQRTRSARKDATLADTIGARFASRGCRCWGLGAGQMMQGNLVGAAAQFREVVAEADAAHDVVWRFNGLQILAHVLAYQGDTSAARAAANAAIEAAAELGEVAEGGGYLTLAVAALAAGDVAAADDAIAAGWHHISVQPEVAATFNAYVAQAALARGDLTTARTLGRRRRRGGDRLAPVAGADDACARGDRAG